MSPGSESRSVVSYLPNGCASMLGSPFPADGVAEGALGVDSAEDLKVEPAD